MLEAVPAGKALGMGLYWMEIDLEREWVGMGWRWGGDGNALGLGMSWDEDQRYCWSWREYCSWGQPWGRFGEAMDWS